MPKLNKLNKFSLTILRFVIGLIFTYHGYMKLFVIGGLPSTTDFFGQIGIPLPNIASVLVAFVEFIGGISLIFGLLTRWSCVLLILEMIVAFFLVNLNKGFLVSKGGYEFVLLILVVLLVILLNGAGSLSLGKILFKNKQMH